MQLEITIPILAHNFSQSCLFITPSFKGCVKIQFLTNPDIYVGAIATNQELGFSP